MGLVRLILHGVTTEMPPEAESSVAWAESGKRHAAKIAGSRERSRRVFMNEVRMILMSFITPDGGETLQDCQ